MINQKKIILVVDDEIELTEVIIEIFSERGYECISAQGGDEAFQILKERNGNIDIILSDIKMPNGDGIELLKNIKNSKFNTNVYLMTGQSEHDEAQLKKEGATEVFYKPMSFEIVFAEFEKKLNQP